MGIVESAVEARLKANKGRLPAKAARFRERSDDILGEYGRLSKSREPLSPFDSAGGYFRRESYGLILDYLTLPRTIERLSKYSWRVKRQPTIEINPFYWGLLAIDPSSSVIGLRDLSLASMQMLHAHRHKVPKEYLIGFTYQCGSQVKLRNKVRAATREHTFDLARTGTLRSAQYARQFARGC